MVNIAPIPADLLPKDGRFGSGPSRIRPEQIEALRAPLLMGTSHRKAPVKSLVASIREGLRSLYALPEGYEVVLGNGGASAFWDVAVTSLVRERAAFGVFGEFGSKFATEVDRAPHLDAAIRVSAEAGALARLTGTETNEDGASPDVFAYPHHETSTGVLSPVERIGCDDALTVVDATSVAGAAQVDVSAADAYYFSPQKAFGSDGGLWLALLSPQAMQRAEELHCASDRWMPSFLDLSLAVKNSVKDQTLNTPAIATLIMLDRQIAWMLDEGGLNGMEARSRAASEVLYRWADSSPLVRPFVSDASHRSHVVVTLEFDESVDTKALSAALRAQGIVDVDPYRGVGGKQLRIGTWPTTPVSDVEALVACLNWLLEHSA